MTHVLFSTLIAVHVLLGSLALASFWIPVFTRKARGIHTRFGKLFAWSMMATAGTAGLAAALTIAMPLATHPEASPDGVLSLRLGPGLMLAYLASITFVAAYSGLRAIRLRGDHGAHRRGPEVMVNLIAFSLALTVLVVGFRVNSVLLMALSAIGLIGVPGNLRFIYRAPRTRQDWLFQHMGSMLGAGIAAHTAFLIFGTARIAPAFASEPLVWLAPTLIGTPVTSLWIRRYRHRFAAPGKRTSAAATGGVVETV